MSNSKACVVFTTGLSKKAQAVSQELRDNGFNVCLAGAEQAVVEAAQASQPVPPEVQSCIDGATISIFLLPEDNYAGVASAAAHAAAQGKTIVVIAENVESLPEVFDDHAHSVLTIDSECLSDAIQGKKVWEKADGSLAKERKIDRVKCQ